MALSPDTLIAGHYRVETARPLPEAGGGLPAFAARDDRAAGVDLIAIQVARRAPARARALQMLAEPVEGVLHPLAHGSVAGPGGEPAYFVICPAPPGPALSAPLRPWSEHALIDLLLRPVAHVLEQLTGRNVTHRAIRPNNIFQGQRGQPVVLGAAWAAPPAMHQPALFEPPYSAMCHPAGRGDGDIADDVYALGVVLVTLALGRLPLAGLDDATILRRKLDLGSHAALVGDERLPPVIADLTRGMLAEDPEHRPPPLLLLDPVVARGRRVAARPPRRAQHPLPVGETAVWNARALAHAMATEPEQGLVALRGGAAVQWLRRGLGDAALVARLEEMLRQRADSAAEEIRSEALTLMRAIAIIDPLAPLCWRGVAVWPDGLGPALAAAAEDSALPARFDELIAFEAIGTWAVLRPERCDAGLLRVEARQHRAWQTTRGLAGGMPRLTYMLNPLLPCASPLMGKHWVGRLGDLPMALEAAAAANPSAGPIDPHVVAFVAARAERRLDVEANTLTGDANSVDVAELRLLAQLQMRFHPTPMPALAAQVAGKVGPLIEAWRNRARRNELAQRIREIAQSGMLVPMVALLEDPPGRRADAQAAHIAAAELAQIDAELQQIAAGAAGRGATAERIGQEVAAGIGLAALAVILALAALG
ncbi:MAG TPA: hypothetical protein VGG99_08390 [Acetobacteraceae bacterium]|jgi:hypothetical protein